MNILFLTISRINNINQQEGVYTDLLRKFAEEDHSVFIVSPAERRFKQKTYLQQEDNVSLLKIKTLNIQKTNFIEKGIGTLLLEYQYMTGVKKYFSDVHFDLILYSTPPITLVKIIKYAKQKYNARTYLMLKDIFPQNAVDIGLMSSSSIFYKMFRKKEKKLYALSDSIGCMSPANVDYVLKHNQEIHKDKVEICPNSLKLTSEKSTDKTLILSKYNIPLDVPVFIYGGNLGKPQGIDFLIQCMEANKNRTDCFFVIVGSGTEYKKLSKWYNQEKPKNILLQKALPKNEYDQLVKSCDVGLIFLDYRFTIPNYPSRLLSYLKYKMPILAATDKSTDIGKIAEENGYGLSCLSNSVDDFTNKINIFTEKKTNIKSMGEKGYEFLLKNYTVDTCYEQIIKNL